MALLLKLYPKVVQEGFVMVLCGEAGIGEISIDASPILKAAVVEQTEVLCDDKGCDACLKALPKE